jgi:chaperonin GroEL
MLGETMTCEKVIIDKELTTFSGCNPNKELVEKEIESIKSKLNSNSLDEVETKFHLKRLANYTGGVATIYVGGYSQVEITEKKDRVDDAICAVKAALQEGVLPGGGSALWYCANKLDLKYLGKVLPLPLCILSQMSNYVGDFPNNLWSGIDFKNHKIGDMLELGIIDPFLVTKTALENAVSVASLILTNECSIINMD